MLSRILEQRKMIDIFLATRMACRDNAGGDCLIDETLDSTTSAAAEKRSSAAPSELYVCKFLTLLYYIVVHHYIECSKISKKSHFKV